MGRALYRVGALVARHRVATVGIWMVLAVSAVVAVRLAGAKTNNVLDLPGTDSQAAFDILARRFPPQQNGTNPFVFHVDDGSLTDPRNKAAIDATFKAIKSDKSVYSVLNPLGSKGAQAGIITKDGRTAFMPVLLNVDSGFITEELADRILAATAPARRADIRVAVGGAIGSELSTPDTRASELIGNISAMVILALVFGSLIAMGIPILTALFALAIATSVIGLVGHVVSVPTVAPTLAVMIGLGVGIDYALFLITKHKEQLGQGMEMRESIAQSAASSGSAVVFAGGTVVIALLSLSVAGIPLVSALGLAAAIAVLGAVLASLTLLPAMLSLVGTGVDRLRIPTFLRPKVRGEGERRWDAWARGIAAHRWLALGAAFLILAPLTVPLFSLTLGQEDIGVTPTSTTERQAYDLMAAGFGVGYNGPLLIAGELSPPAKPSAEYTSKYDKATALKRRLEREQKQLTKQAAALRREQAELDREAADLRRRQSALERRAAALDERKAQLLQEEGRLRDRAVRLAERAAPLVARLALILARERIVQSRIDQTTDPNLLRRLRRRLDRLQAREQDVRASLQPLIKRARVLLAQAEQLRAQADELQRRAAALAAQGAVLQAEGEQLQAMGDQLEAEADKLKERQREARAQKKRAEKLQGELTAMLTRAGGDPRGTDPRIVRLQNALEATEGVVGLFPLQINDGGDAATLSAVPLRAPSSDATADLVERLRDTVLPNSTSEGGIEVHVGGTTASNVDLATKISSRLPIVVMTVILLSFVLLLVAFRSLLIPLQAAVTNLLTVGAALGVLTATFQWGWGLSVIGLDAPRGTVPIASYVPLMMFAVLFGLSMDYEVFLVSRIEQHRAGGELPSTAVTSGLGTAAHVVVAAALIMFLVFASFIINGDPTVKQFGTGLAAAVLLAGIMVVLLAPAMLGLFGRRVFWVPRWLDRILPHLDIEGGANAQPPGKAPPEPEGTA
jgi:uncharacterized membrane protein YdfJ with MMPL/SSD domain/peptidoglycan hydrolase CwlO-like protein